MYLGRLVLAFVGFILLIFLVILLFVGGGKKKAPTTPVKPLTSYSNTDATVSMTIDGPINGDDAHRAIKITIGEDSRELDVIQGYSGTVIQSNPSYNSKDAYNVFLHAINSYGFTLKGKNQPANLDSTGQCALGNRYTFTLEQEGNVISSLWTTSCGSKTGNFAGNSQILQELFQAQITNYNTLTENVSLND